MDDFLWAIEIVTAAVVVDDDAGVQTVAGETVAGVKGEVALAAVGGAGSVKKMLRSRRGRGRLKSLRADGRKSRSGLI